MTVRRIMHASDFSPVSRGAFRVARELAGALKAQLILCHAWERVVPYAGGPPPEAVPPNVLRELWTVQLRVRERPSCDDRAHMRGARAGPRGGATGAPRGLAFRSGHHEAMVTREESDVAHATGSNDPQFPESFGRYMVDSVEGCAEQVIHLLKHPGARGTLGRAGREHVRRQFLLPRLPVTSFS